MTDKITYENFMDRLIEEVPEIKEIYDADVEYFGEVIPYGIMSQIFRYVTNQMQNSVPEYIIKLIKFLDDVVISSDDETNNLICIEFLEPLLAANDGVLGRVESLLGPNLKKELKKMRDWRPK